MMSHYTTRGHGLCFYTRASMTLLANVFLPLSALLNPPALRAAPFSKGGI